MIDVQVFVNNGYSSEWHLNPFCDKSYSRLPRDQTTAKCCVGYHPRQRVTQWNISFFPVSISESLRLPISSCHLLFSTTVGKNHKMNNRGIPPTSSILWFYPSMLHGYIPIIFLCGCRIGQAGLTTKYPEHSLAKGEEAWLMYVGMEMLRGLA